MKRILTTIMLLLAAHTYSLDIYGYIEATAYDYYRTDLGDHTDQKQLLSLDLGLWHRSDFFRVGGSVRTFMYTQRGSIYYTPSFADYDVFAELIYKNVSIGIEHRCSHDVIGDMRQGMIEGINGGFNRVYARIEW